MQDLVVGSLVHVFPEGFFFWRVSRARYAQVGVNTLWTILDLWYKLPARDCNQCISLDTCAVCKGDETALADSIDIFPMESYLARSQVIVYVFLVIMYTNTSVPEERFTRFQVLQCLFLSVSIPSYRIGLYNQLVLILNQHQWHRLLSAAPRSYAPTTSQLSSRAKAFVSN